MLQILLQKEMITYDSQLQALKNNDFTNTLKTYDKIKAEHVYFVVGSL